jgi:hypothetical protein
MIALNYDPQIRARRRHWESEAIGASREEKRQASYASCWYDLAPCAAEL